MTPKWIRVSLDILPIFSPMRARRRRCAGSTRTGFIQIVAADKTDKLKFNVEWQQQRHSHVSHHFRRCENASPLPL